MADPRDPMMYWEGEKPPPRGEYLYSPYRSVSALGARDPSKAVYRSLKPEVWSELEEAWTETMFGVKPTPVSIDPKGRRVPIAKLGYEGSEQGFGRVLGRLRELEGAAPRLPSALKRPGIGQAGSTEAFQDLFSNLQSAGHRFRAEIVDNHALRVHLLHGPQGKAVGATFEMPIQVGQRVLGAPTIMDYTDPVLQQMEYSQPEFIARSRYAQVGDEWRPVTHIESLVAGLKERLGLVEADPRRVSAWAAPTSEKELRKLAASAQRFITGQGQEGLDWIGVKRGVVDPETGIMKQGRLRGPYEQLGSIFDVYKMGTMGIYREPSALAGRTMAEQEQQFGMRRVAGKDQFIPEASLQQISTFIRRADELGVPLSNLGISDSSALAGNLGAWGPGEITPFGATADPSRQAYQRLAIAQLVGEGKTVTPVSTPMVEAAKRFIGREATPGRGRSKWGVDTRIALVLDPRFEQAVAGSGGGAVVTPELARELSADITNQLDLERAKFQNLIDPSSGRAISKAVVGTPLITSLGTKQTIASIKHMTGAQMAIGWSTFLKGKRPEAIREAVLRDIMEQVGPFPRGWRYGQRSTQADLVAPLYQKLAEAIRGEADDVTKFQKVWTGERYAPQILVGEKAAFGLPQLRQINKAIDQYNKDLRNLQRKGLDTGLKEVRKGFEAVKHRIGGLGDVMSFIVHGDVMRRLESQEVVTKAVGSWTRPHGAADWLRYALAHGQIAARGEYDPTKVKDDLYLSRASGTVRGPYKQDYHPEGIKMRPKDVRNLRLYRTKEANDLADHYEKLIKGWASEEKQEMAKVLSSMGVTDDIEWQGHAKIPQAMSVEELATQMGKFRAAPRTGAAQYSADDLAGTIFGETSELRKRGTAVRLPWHVEIAGIEGVTRGVPTKEIYLPGLEMYRGLSPMMEDLPPGAQQSPQYLNKILRKHEELLLMLSDPNIKAKKADFEQKLRSYHNTLFDAFGGKKGLWSYMSTARMAHSGYLGLVPGGVDKKGQWASAALGTALEDYYTAHISETAAKQMGVTHLFDRSSGYAYGRLTAYPSTGPTTESVMRFKMVSDSQLGSRSLRISNLIALTMFRDFDADKAGVTFLTQKDAQSLMKEMHHKTVRPRLKWHQEVYEDLLDVDLWQMQGGGRTEQRIAQAVKEGREGTSVLRHSLLLRLAQEKGSAIGAKIKSGDYLADKFTTKVMTPAVNWYMEQFRWLANETQTLQRAKDLGLVSHTGFRRATDSIMALIEQQAAISKGQGILESAKTLFKHMGTEWGADKVAYEKAIEETSGSLLRMTGVSDEIADDILRGKISKKEAQRYVGAALGARGDWTWIASKKWRDRAARDLLAIGTVRAEILKAGGEKMPEFYQLLSKRREIEAAAGVGLGALKDILSNDRFLAEGDRRGAIRGVMRNLMGSMGILQALDIKTGTSLADMQQWKKEVEEAAEQNILNRSVKEQAEATGMTVLDRASRWWTHEQTPYWQKAGVITGAAILLGAVAKNTLFPGYGPEGPPPGQPQTAYPSPHFVAAMPPIPQPVRSFEPEPAYNLARKPGGLWGYVSKQTGSSPDAYRMDSGVEMYRPLPSFGPRIQMPGFGLDVGPGIADSRSRPMILAGPPVGGGAPMPPPIPRTSPSESDVPFVSPISDPPARMQLPDHMRAGMNIAAVQGMDNSPAEELAELMMDRFGTVNLTYNQWDPSEGVVDRMLYGRDQSLSSF